MRLSSFVLFFTILMFSCGKTNESPLQSTKWKVNTIRTDLYTFTQPPSPYTLEFHQGDTYTWKLDVNTCTGSFETGILDRIRMDEEVSCTEICCDSSYVDYMLDLVKKTDRYSISNDKLYLKGYGVVVLESVE